MFLPPAKIQLTRFLIAVTFLAPSFLSAQDRTQGRVQYIPRPSAAAPSEAAPTVTVGEGDYTAAFQKLIDLGLPDVSGAKYIKLKFATEEPSQGDYYYQRYSIKRSGNAWLLPSENPKTTERKVIHSGLKVAKVAAKKKRSLLVRLVAGSDDKTREGVRKAEWSEVDGEKEVSKIIRQLDEDQSLSRIFDGSNWTYDTSASKALGELLITAAHLHRSGQTEAGNKLAHYLLTKSPFPFKLVDHVVGELAAAEYQTLLNALFADQKWEPFLKGIRELSIKYPRGWKEQIGIKLLIPKVATHVRLGKVALRPYKKQALAPAIVKALDQVLTPPEAGQAIVLNAPYCWLINPDGKITTRYGESRTTPDWVTAIITSGMDALPTLIAASVDGSLIPAPMSSLQSGYHQSFSSSSGDDEELTTYKNMARPCTRGEIIRKLLQLTLPAEGIDWETISPEEFQITAYDWWSQNRDKSPTQIALLFLEEGDNSQKNLAMQTLLKSGEESAYPVIEDFILASSPLMNNVELAKEYLEVRKGEGKAFHDTFVASLKQELESSFSSGDNQQLEKYLKQTISSLAVLVNETSPEKVMAQITAGETSVEDGLPLLRIAIGEGGFIAHLGPLLSFITKLDEPADRLTALQKLQQWTYDRSDFSTETSELTEKKKELRELTKTHLDLWKTFLARTGDLEQQIDEKILRGLGKPPSEAHYAAMVMDALHHPETLIQLRAVNTVAKPAEAWALILKRMQDYAQSGVLPDFPNAQSVPKERQETILSEVKKLPPLEIIPYRESLSLSERLALSSLLDEIETLPPNVAKLAQICQNIDWSRATNISQETREAVEQALLGKKISAQLITAALEICEAQQPGLMLFARPAGTSITGPILMGWTTKGSSGWANQYLGEEFSSLDGEKLKSLKALIVFGLDGEDNDEPQSAVRFSPAANEAEENEAYDQLLQKALSIFEPNEDQESQSPQRGLLLVYETFENHKASSDDEEEDE